MKSKKKLLFDITIKRSNTFVFYGYKGHLWRSIVEPKFVPEGFVPASVHGQLMSTLQLQQLYK